MPLNFQKLDATARDFSLRDRETYSKIKGDVIARKTSQAEADMLLRGLWWAVLGDVPSEA